MNQKRWSLADLEQQRLVVRLIASRAELDRSRLGAARYRLLAAARNALRSPPALVGCFVAGVAVGRRKSRHADAGRKRTRWPAVAGMIFRTLVLSALARGLQGSR